MPPRQKPPAKKPKPKKPPVPTRPRDPDGFESLQPPTLPTGNGGRPRSETRKAYGNLVDGPGYERAREMLEGQLITVPILDKQGKDTGQVRQERIFPKPDVVLKALELAARISRFLSPGEHDSEPTDLPPFELVEDNPA